MAWKSKVEESFLIDILCYSAGSSVVYGSSSTFNALEIWFYVSNLSFSELPITEELYGWTLNHTRIKDTHSSM